MVNGSYISFPLSATWAAVWQLSQRLHNAYKRVNQYYPRNQYYAHEAVNAVEKSIEQNHYTLAAIKTIKERLIVTSGP